ncbi:MAG: imidazole glycerol phosphate synthase subunit HisH [Shewanella sp.]|nr:imidazole glycerol phosphate synthase subunit HisH [Shewanella sp.]MCF1430814.1 imidazole glycerol phosphate synthase subunit HisH [Shewanella sp.]MCF1439040.1 imidazole glycerol phosphate synthase subunit HisH [Shewanella sp.]MCF1458044.1 imidazole glycerol phosphate synthase subunit HisH [Shewanella sp.]
MTVSRESMNTVIIDTGCANLSSVRFALMRLGETPTVTADPAIIRRAARVILPGVGSARAAMQSLHAKGLDTLVPSLIQPLLGVCLGMQLLCRQSSEGGEAVPCLGIIDTEITELDSAGLPLPHMGWNAIRPSSHPLFAGISREDYLYFVHSYCAPVGDFTLASCDYGQSFSAAIGQGNFMGVQFHPEKSAGVGALILKNFLEMNA